MQPVLRSNRCWTSLKTRFIRLHDFHVADAHANADAYFADALPVSPTVMFMVLMLVPMLILPKLSSNSADTDDHA